MPHTWNDHQDTGLLAQDSNNSVPWAFGVNQKYGGFVSWQQDEIVRLAPIKIDKFQLSGAKECPHP